MTDVTKRIKNSGFEYSDEQKYKLYKADMDKAYDSEQNPDRREYKKQQWLLSEGLSDEEKAMARRYFHEKEGGSKGPRSRGGPRNRPQTIPAEIMAEGSDTVDTNYADVPVAQPTGTLEFKKEFSGEDAIKNQIKQHEGLRLKPYKDTKGLWTIGYGHLIGKQLPDEWNRAITKAEAEDIFEKDYAEHRKAAEKIPGFDKLNESGKRALIDLTFNMGADWVRVKGFKRFEAAMSQPVPDVYKAAESLEDSKWYEQVKGRGRVVVNDLRAGLAPSGTSTMMAKNTPVPSSMGSTIDSANRELMALNSPNSGAAVVATTVVNNQTNNNVGKRPMAKADVATRDDSLIRTARKDSRHPAFS